MHHLIPSHFTRNRWRNGAAWIARIEAPTTKLIHRIRRAGGQLLAPLSVPLCRPGIPRSRTQWPCPTWGWRSTTPYLPRSSENHMLRTEAQMILSWCRLLCWSRSGHRWSTGGSGTCRIPWRSAHSHNLLRHSLKNPILRWKLREIRIDHSFSKIQDGGWDEPERVLYHYATPTHPFCNVVGRNLISPKGSRRAY